jgi:hypothetical protein
MTTFNHLRSGSSGPSFDGSAQNDVILWDTTHRKWFVGALPQVEAVDVAYDPENPSDWGSTPPERVAAALDSLASLLAYDEQANGAITPAGTITFTTTAITPKRSGFYLVLASIAGTNSAAGTEALQLLADNVIIDSAETGTGNGNKWQATLMGLDHVTVGAPHTFSVVAVASTGTTTVSPGFAKIITIELGG